MAEFGVADAEFLPYWDNDAELSVAPAGATVSGYLRADGKAALLIACGTEHPATYTIDLRGRLAALRGKPARNAVTNDALKWDDGKLLWALPGKGVQLIIIAEDQ